MAYICKVTPGPQPNTQKDSTLQDERATTEGTKKPEMSDKVGNSQKRSKLQTANFYISAETPGCDVAWGSGNDNSSYETTTESVVEYDDFRRMGMDVMAGNLKMQSGTTSLADEDYIYLEKHRNGDEVDQNHTLDDIKRKVAQGKDNTLHKRVVESKRNDVESVKTCLHNERSPYRKCKMIERELILDIPGEGLTGLSCLHLAACFGHTNLVCFFLDEGVHVDHKDSNGNTALMWASRWGHTETVKTLIETGANTNLQNRDGSTALYWAVRYGHAETVELLLEEGEADPNLKREHGLNYPLIVASANGNNKIPEYGGLETDSEGLIFLHHSANHDKNEVIEKCYTHTNISARTLKGNTPLHIACRNGCNIIIKTLLQYEARVDITNDFGTTPLHFAARSTKLQADTVRELVSYAYKKHGSNILNVKDKYSNNCLHIACGSGCDSTIKSLLEYKASVDVKNHHGETPLHCAARSSKIKADTVRELVSYAYKKHGSNVLNYNDKDLNNCLHIAGMFATPAVMWEFRSARMTDQNRKGFTPLHTAVRPEEPDALLMMLKIFDESGRAGRINETSYDKHTVLHLAAEAQLSSCVGRLIDLGADVSIKDSDGNTVLHKLVELTVSEPENSKRYEEVFGKIFKRWASKYCVDHAANSDYHNYDELYRDGSLFLMNKIYNAEGLSLLEYSFKKGAVDVISQLLMMRNVTMFAVEDSQYMFDVSRLVPHTKQNSLEHKQSHNKVMPSTDEVENRKHDTHLSCVELFLDQEIRREATFRFNYLMGKTGHYKRSKCLDLLPLRQLKLDYTSFTCKLGFILLLCHIIYMTIFSYVGENLTTKLQDDENAVNSSDPETMLLYILVPIVPIMSFLKLFKNIKICMCDEYRRRLCSKDIFISSLSMIFAALIFVWIALISVHHHNHDYWLAVCLWMGWLGSIVYLRYLRPVFVHTKLIKQLFMNEVYPFILVYIFVLFAHANLFHIFSQGSPGNGEKYESIGTTLLVTFNMMLGHGEMFDEDFKKDLEVVNRTAAFAEIFYIIYMIISTIILLNLLIAMMNYYYSNFQKEQNEHWDYHIFLVGIDMQSGIITGQFYGSGSCQYGLIQHRRNSNVYLKPLKRN